MITVIAPKPVEVGGIPVQRVLPRAGRRTIGAWCFVDTAGPIDVEVAAMQVGPHPHIGIHTVSWMIAGELVHRDSLGSEQVLRPGQLNLMSAGHGIAHAEQASTTASGSQHLVQLWVAQPESTRHSSPDFAHHSELPHFGIGACEITVLLGAMGNELSPARCDTPLVGADLVLREPLQLPVNPHFEHGLLPPDNDIAIHGQRIAAGSLAYLPAGHEMLSLAPTTSTSRVVLIGGEPFEEQLRMHWNFVARTNNELTQAVDDWNNDTNRFGAVGGGLSRIPAPNVVTFS